MFFGNELKINKLNNNKLEEKIKLLANLENNKKENIYSTIRRAKRKSNKRRVNLFKIYLILKIFKEFT
jgi:hypothetical protein